MAFESQFAETFVVDFFPQLILCHGQDFRLVCGVDGCKVTFLHQFRQVMAGIVHVVQFQGGFCGGQVELGRAECAAELIGSGFENFCRTGGNLPVEFASAHVTATVKGHQFRIHVSHSEGRGNEKAFHGKDGFHRLVVVGQCGGCGEVFQFTMPVHDICRIVIGVSPVSHVQVHSGAESVGRKRVEPVGLAFRPILYVEQFFGLVYVRQDGGIDLCHGIARQHFADIAVQFQRDAFGG